ncbi:MAG: exopolysaccharide biosynthesis protein, partial [Dongiaceae bacterium]
HLRLAERVLCRRFPALTSRSMERLIGAVCLVLAVLISLPIPFTGIPLAVPVIVLSLGIIERDGAFILFGLAGAAVAATYAFLVAQTALLAMLFVTGPTLGL